MRKARRLLSNLWFGWVLRFIWAYASSLVGCLRIFASFDRFTCIEDKLWYPKVMVAVGPINLPLVDEDWLGQRSLHEDVVDCSRKDHWARSLNLILLAKRSNRSHLWKPFVYLIPRNNSMLRIWPHIWGPPVWWKWESLVDAFDY